MISGLLRTATIVLPLLALTACGSADQPAKKQAMAGGQILEASVSDAMLPLDQVRSQPPLAPRPSAAATPGQGATSDAAQDGAEDGPEPEKAAEAPAEPKPDAE